MQTKLNPVWYLAKIRKKWNHTLQLPAKILLGFVFSEALLLWFFCIWNLLDSGRQKICPDQDEDLCTKYVMNTTVALIFSIFLLMAAVLDGIFFDNIYELYSALVNLCLTTGYSIFKFVQKYENDVIDHIQMIWTVICLFVFICCLVALHKEYQWRTYKKAGSDPEFIKMYGQYLLLMCVKKMDFIYTIMAVLLSGNGVFSDGWESAIDVVMAVLAITNMVFGYIGFYYENKQAVWFYWIDFIPHPIYFAYHFYGIHEMGPHKYLYRTEQVTVAFFLVYAAVAILAHLIALPASIICYANFGQGLKEMEFLNNRDKDQPLGQIR